jgi:excinuclease UvrABC helicase subunit UvrB
MPEQYESLAKSDLMLEIDRIEEEMLSAAHDLRFEEAAALRDVLQLLQGQLVLDAVPQSAKRS